MSVRSFAGDTPDRAITSPRVSSASRSAGVYSATARSAASCANRSGSIRQTGVPSCHTERFVLPARTASISPG